MDAEPRPPRDEWWPLLLGACAVLGLLAGALWVTSLQLGAIATIPTVQRYELRAVPPDDPQALQFNGPLLEHSEDAALPIVGHPAGGALLRKARLTIDLTPYLTATDVYDDERDGDRQTTLRGPTKAILISQAVHGVDIYLNGVWLDGYPRSTAQDRFMWFRPLMVELPRKLLRRDGANQLVIDYTSWEPHLTFSPVFIGDVGPIAYMAEALDFVGGSLASASKAFCFLTGLFMIGVWLANRSDDTFGLVGAVALLWAAVYTLSLWIHLPAAWRGLWLWSFYACTGALNALTVLFILRFIGQKISIPAAVLLALCSSAAAVISPWLGGEAKGQLAYSWILLMLPMQTWALWRLGRHVLRTRSRPALLLLLLLLVAAVLILHDFNVMAHRIGPLNQTGHSSLLRLLGTPMYLTHLALPPLLVVMARVHLAKYRQSTDRVREANRILSDSLRRREMELSLAYDRQSSLERREAAQDERDRIYRELHDGIGSRLIATLFSVRDGVASPAQLEHSLMEVLQGVREVVSTSRQREERELQNILFDYCVNLDSLLSGKEFQLEYEIPGDHEFVMLDDGARELLRVVEETVANTLKYANASRLRIELHQTDTSVLLSIVDNGHSTLPENLPQRPAFGASTGRGLAHMRERMKALGGRFEFELTAAGGTTWVTLPLVAEDAPLKSHTAGS
ncbi:Signal transduction histidine kinase [Roseateles sp. YR242]|nr:Signal transduction histidine kinase [Roseateles sp. YR242]